MKRKEVDDVLGGDEMWKHADSTDASCDKCNNRRAFFYQLQIRSADEPMTTFYRRTMSDQSPPPTKPKPGSLRDRIAAFENKGAPAPGPAPGGPPAPRPKPGNLQWKPHAPSPPGSPDQPAGSRAPGGGGMSASDAKESISRGGTLRERMAALQGKGAFGAPGPAPAVPAKPAAPVEKPRWKPPPRVVSPPPPGEDDDSAPTTRAPSRSPPPRRATSPSSDVFSKASEGEPDAAAAQGDRASPSPEPEEDERQRRAAIAARMARLGGARIGMAPPVIAPKPSVRKPQSPPPPAPAPEPTQEESKVEPEAEQPQEASTEPPRRESLGSQSIKDEVTTTDHEPSTERKDSDQASIASASSNRAPSSMPVPAAPRRAAPPRRKTYKSPPSTALPEPPALVPGAEADAEAMPSQSSSTSSLLPPVTTAPKVSSPEQLVSSSPDESRVMGDVQPEIGVVNKSADPSDVSLRPPGDVDEGLVMGETIVDEPAKTEEEEMEEDVQEQEGIAEGEASIKRSSTYETAKDDLGPAEADESSEVQLEREPEQEQAPGPEPEEDEEDEEARRKRVAARLAQMGAFNPFAGPPPIPRRTSVDVPQSQHEQPDVDEEANVDTEEVGETVPSPPATTVHPSVSTVRKRTEDELVEKTEVEADVEAEEADEAVKPARVQRDVTNEHEIGLERASAEPTLTIGAEAEVTHRMLYHNTGMDNEQECIVSPPLDADVDAEGDGSSIEENRLAESTLALGGGPGDVDRAEELPESESDLGAGEQIAAVHTEIDARGVVSPQPETSDCPGSDADDAESPVAAAAVRDGDYDDDMAPPRITRPIPPPPVNLSSKPTLAPHSPPPRNTLHTLRDEDEDRASSPDIPPRPIPPPPVRSVSDVAEVTAPSPPRRSMPPPPRRSSLRYTEPTMEMPPPPPPVLTSPPRPARRPTSPPIITTLPIQQEPEQLGDEEFEAPASQVQEPEDDDVVRRRRTIAERMARLGAIRFDAPAPMHHLARPPLPPAPPPTSIPPDDSEVEVKEEEETQNDDEEDEASRRERIAAKIAGMGGLRLGMLPPSVGMAPSSARRLVSRQEDSENEDVVLPVPVPAPQRAPPSRKLPPHVAVEPEHQGLGQSEKSGHGMSDDDVKMETEESEIEIEEVHYSDADVHSLSAEEEEVVPPLPPPRLVATSKPMDALPTPPPRSVPGRPPVPSVPASLLNRRASTTAGSAPSSRKSSLDYSSTAETPTAPPSHPRASQEAFSSESSFRPQSDYVMVDVGPALEEAPAPPPRRPTRAPPRSIPPPPPPPPSAIDPPEDRASSIQWELPSIPQGAELVADSDLASTGWSDDSTAVHVPPPPPPQAPVPSNPTSRVPSSTHAVTAPSVRSTASIDQQKALSSDDLMGIWGKVGVQVAEAASGLFEKSKRALVGDGSYAGFVGAVIAQVPDALRSSDPDEWGYLVYAQTGTMVHRRVAEIMPGDVIAFRDAKLKGHKGLHTYSQTVGAGESGALVGVVSEFEGKKSKVRVWQANQNVGQQSVESVSYRLEDLKSGHVKVFRILEKAM
ncbi:hypothetical protein ID866_8770 [Astraeus odoratus]|nr:hypothetical protein ID866_8770 [Astraeus odoratus]